MEPCRVDGGGYSLCMFPLFNKEIVKFHVPYVMLKDKFRNRDSFMERQLTLLPAVDDKKVQKEVVSVLKEYRALKMRFSNDVEQEGISLFPELRDSRNTSKWKVQRGRESTSQFIR